MLKTLSGRFPSLPFTFPKGEDGKPLEGVYEGMKGSYRGAHLHLHITRNKWDAAGLEAQIIYLMRKDVRVAEEFEEFAVWYDVGSHIWDGWEKKLDTDWVWDTSNK